jgi:hypothetical protein
LMRQSQQTVSGESALDASAPWSIAILNAAVPNTFGSTFTTTSELPESQNSSETLYNTNVASATPVSSVQTSEMTNGDTAGGEIRVPTGPLVSRNSSPLAPLLASLEADPTPPVDRHERATLQELGIELGGGGDNSDESSADPTEGMYSTATVAMNHSSRQDGAGEFGDIGAGSGGTYFGIDNSRSGTVDLRVLAAAMAGSRKENEKQGDRSGVGAAPMEPELAAHTVTTASMVDDSEGSGALATACGVMLVVGLSSGPVLPELLPRLRKMVPVFGARRLRGSRGPLAT